MLNSLRLYAKFFIMTLPGPERRFLWLDMERYVLRPGVFRSIPQYSSEIRRESLDKGAGWLLEAQKAAGDGGMGSYHLVNKWSSSYPETTGYIIPTLIDYGGKFNKPEVLEAAVRAADFLLGIQKESGGWQGGRVNENKPEIVFNTGQVIRGMMAAYEHTGDSKYIDSAARAGDWLCKIQHPEGFWKSHALMNEARVYDTYVDAPLLHLAEITGKKKYRDATVKNLDWVTENKLLQNGWCEDCDNTVRRNDKPILHTIAYTLEGLIDCSRWLKDEKYLQAAIPGASVLCDLFLQQGILNGRYDHHWKGREHFICTGGAQMAIVWLKLFWLSREERFRLAAGRMIDLLIFIQRRFRDEKPETLGAIPGSFPLWGRYEPFAFPNWATKFFCDALMLEEEMK